MEKMWDLFAITPADLNIYQTLLSSQQSLNGNDFMGVCNTAQEIKYNSLQRILINSHVFNITVCHKMLLSP